MELYAAGGRVRCGACLNIFDAKANFLVEQKGLFEAGLDPENDAPIEPHTALEPIADDQEPAGGEALIGDPEAGGAPGWQGWWAVLLLGLLALPVQAIWWQPQTLLEQNWYRQSLAASCAWLPCEVRQYRNLDQIELSGLVQPSKSHANVLTALIEMRNRAELPQPFPAIRMRFSNLAGEVVAERLFEPYDYLRREAAGRSHIRAGQRVQIEMHIHHAGSNALSYEFEPVFAQADSAD